MKLLKMKKLFCIFLVFNLVTWGLFFIVRHYSIYDAITVLVMINPVLMLTDIHIEDGISSLIIFKIIIGILIETLYISTIGFLLKHRDFHLSFVAFIISLPYALCSLFITCIYILDIFGLYAK